ncbi:hypothetical protein WMF45_21695 [Sorangium sp. So ce448]
MDLGSAPLGRATSIWNTNGCGGGGSSRQGNQAITCGIVSITKS